jgi:adenosylcobinamide kinase / adenosylcobinamide-phosphate guanylyltransferase
MIIFIAGGVRSGKSSFAETAAVYYGGKTIIHYIATSARHDGEMNKRIQRHRDERDKSGYAWKTWEQPRDIHVLDKQIEPSSVLLLDCVTNLLNNELFHGWEENRDHWLDETYRSKIYQKIREGIFLLGKERTLILVSNEVFYGLPLRDKGTYYFAKMLGGLHQELVRLSDWVYQVEQGLPILRKGPDEHGKQILF